MWCALLPILLQIKIVQAIASPVYVLDYDIMSVLLYARFIVVEHCRVFKQSYINASYADVRDVQTVVTKHYFMVWILLCRGTSRVKHTS